MITNTQGNEMYHAKQSTIQKLADAFGFDVVVLGSQNHNLNGEIETRYSVKRPNGNRQYHAMMDSKGRVKVLLGGIKK